MAIPSNLDGKRARWPENTKGAQSKLRPPELIKSPKWPALVNGGLGDDAYEHRRKPGVHRRSPPVTLWFLSGDSERNPPNRAEPYSLT